MAQTGDGSIRFLFWDISKQRQRFFLISFALFVVTFAVYWYLGPQETAYSHQVNQANNLIHGHIDFVPEYSRNLNTLERVLYDGEGFCFPPDDPMANLVTDPRFSEDCKTYTQHALGPAFVVIPGVAIWGSELNQTLVSVVFGAMTAPLVFAVSRVFSKKLLNQLALTVLFMFGTIFWWVASNGGVWFFAHTTAVFFLVAGIFFATNRQNPLMAGAMLGAAFLCRPTVILTGLFWVTMFSPLWLRPAIEGRSFLSRIDLGPAYEFVSGLAPFVLAAMFINYIRFDNPLETGYNYGEQVHQDSLQHVYNHGTLHPSYLDRHPPIALEKMPIFDEPGTVCSTEPPLDCAPIRPSWDGMAIWATTPAFLMALFTGVKDRTVARIGALLVALAVAIILSRAVSEPWDSGWATTDIPAGLHLLPFWAMIVVAVLFSISKQNRLVAACWAAIIPTAFLIFMFAAYGWSQFGYRYSLDFMPFLWLLVAQFIGDKLRWWHIVLIAIGIAVNMMGVLWIYQFEPEQTFDWRWVTF